MAAPFRALRAPRSVSFEEEGGARVVVSYDEPSPSEGDASRAPLLGGPTLVCEGEPQPQTQPGIDSTQGGSPSLQRKRSVHRKRLASIYEGDASMYAARARRDWHLSLAVEVWLSLHHVVSRH